MRSTGVVFPQNNSHEGFIGSHLLTGKPGDGVGLESSAFPGNAFPNVGVPQDWELLDGAKRATRRKPAHARPCWSSCVWLPEEQRTTKGPIMWSHRIDTCSGPVFPGPWDWMACGRRCDFLWGLARTLATPL